MTVDGLSDEAITDTLTHSHRIALVGASNKPTRASNGVMHFLLERGYDVTPVNPVFAAQTIHGRAVVPRQTEATPLDMVDVFWNSGHIGPLVDAIIRIGASCI